MNAQVLRRLAVVGLVPLLLLSTPVPAEAATPPALDLIAARDQAQLVRYGREPVWLGDLGLFIGVRNAPLHLQVRRTAYDQPITVMQVLEDGATIAFPDDLVRRFERGFRRFFKITVKQNGLVKKERWAPFCPNTWEPVRLSPDASDVARFPTDCGWSPLILGSTWGIDPGWGAPVAQVPMKLKDGRYRVIVTPQPYAVSLFPDLRPVRIRAEVVTQQDGGWFEPRTLGPTSTSGQPGEEPGPEVIPGASARPDLVAGPAFAIGSRNGPRRDWLTFAATIWNAGPATLVVDGFRRRGEDVMDAYQSFYENGEKVGTVLTGELEYDPRPGHEHWHFKDFATYRLLDPATQTVVTSGKEAFCVVPTDAIDLTVAGAVWRPETTGLGTACGSVGSLSIREVLPTGWGDTYHQGIPGQAFNITNVPNGTYMIQVVANPDGRLYEVTDQNNATVREITLGGVRGARTVTVAPYQGRSF